jgi:hypothetical protein
MAGAKAFSLMLNGLDDLGLDRLNGGLGFKYWLSPTLALQPVLLFSSSKVTTVNSREDYRDRIQSVNHYGIQLGVLKHMAFVNSLTPYWGIAVSYLRTTSTDEYSIPREDPQPGSTDRLEDKDNTLGAALLLGAEWFVRRNISISAHYMVGYSSTSSTSQEYHIEGAGVEQPGEEKETTTSIGISTSYYFIINIYLP